MARGRVGGVVNSAQVPEKKGRNIKKGVHDIGNVAEGRKRKSLSSNVTS